MESGTKEEDEREAGKMKKKSCYKQVGCWVSMAVASMVGGLVFGWWEIQFHGENRQLWMVPFSLVLMIAPIFVMMSVFISSFCTASMDHSTASATLGSSTITPCQPSAC